MPGCAAAWAQAAALEIGARVGATRRIYRLLKRDRNSVLDWTLKAIPEDPPVPMALPDRVHAGDCYLQNEPVQTLFIGPSHTPDGHFV